MRTESGFCATFLAIMVITMAPLAAQAQCNVDTVLNDSDKLAGMDLYFSQGCLGDREDPSPLAKSVWTGLDAVKEDANTDAQLGQRRDQLLDLLSNVEGSLTGKMDTMDSRWRGYAATALTQLQMARNEIALFDSTVRAIYWERGQDYGFFEQPTTGSYLIAYEADIDAACSTAGLSPQCQSAVESLMVLTRHIYLVNRILANEVREHLAALHQELVTLDAEWDYYFSQARSQFWWEFIANNALYNPSGDKFARPPAGQLILFHPGAAMEYVDQNDSVDESLNLVGIIEVIGYNRLRWRADGPISKWPLGLSLIATYVPATPGDDFGYGLMLHVNNRYSFGITRRDTGAGHENTLLFSVDLGRLFLDKSQQAKNLFRKVE